MKPLVADDDCSWASNAGEAVDAVSSVSVAVGWQL